MTDIIGTLAVVLSLKDEASGQVDTALSKIESSTRNATSKMIGDLTDWRDATNANTLEMAKWGTAIGATVAPIAAVGLAAAATVQEFKELADQAAEYVSTMDRLGTTTGLSNEELQRWGNVARYADSNIGDLASMINRLQLNLNDQGEAGDQARAILDQMSVSYKNSDGTMRSMNEVFPEVIQGLRNLSSSGDRVTASNALIGRSYQNVAGYIALGKEGIENYYNTANTLTAEQEEKLRDYEKSVKDLDGTFQHLNYTVGTDLSGSFAEWNDLLNSGALQTGGPIDTFFKNLDGFLTAAARGFHITGQEARAAFQFITGDAAGAMKTGKDLARGSSQNRRRTPSVPPDISRARSGIRRCRSGWIARMMLRKRSRSVLSIPWKQRSTCRKSSPVQPMHTQTLSSALTISNRMRTI